MSGWMAERTHCANGHDLTDPVNVYPQLPNRRRERRCKACIRGDNDLRREAYTMLGLSQREYLQRYGASRAAALRVIRILQDK